ncbi:DUF2326 domain-containing protein [Aeromonas enteropelogenes]|uniref:DUF2326 domain-containing protein n=1 Tax=Aeromonas enteropelogenes TaxID=29489 RepID=UPI00398923DC
MQLIKLNVTDNGHIVRTITFRDGVNIITNSGDDGNQIGKSTVLRAISFCLGSDGQSLWKDPENGKINTDIQSYILSGKVQFELHLKINGIIRTIKRKCEKKPSQKQIKRISWIDNEEFKSQDKFSTAVGALFGHSVETPSFNAIKNKFIRISRKTVNNSYKYLSVFSSDDEYTYIYAYLFDFNGLDKLKQTLVLKKEIKTLSERQSSLLNGNTLVDYKEKLAAIDLEINELERKGEEYDISFFQDKSLEELRNSRIKTAELSNEISSLETRMVFNKKTVSMYESNIKEIDVSAISKIYDEAKTLLPNLSKELSDVIDFHNSIFLKKATYVKSQIEVIKNDLDIKRRILREHLENEKKIFDLLSKNGHLSGFLLIEKEIQDKREQRGRVSFIIDEVSAIADDIFDKELVFSRTQKEIEHGIDALNENLKIFNNSYEAITKSIFKKYKNSLIQNINDRGGLQFSIINENLNTGDGVPRVAAMAFDIAMIEYVKAKNLKLLRFTLQDYLEAIDEESMKLLLKYAEKRGVQVVISILSDKLNLFTSKEAEKYIRLRLSKEDKFFGI